MNIKFLTLLIIFVISISFFDAQNYRIIYKLSYKTDSTSNKMYQKNMILDMNENIESFYSQKMYQSDSLYEANVKNGKENSGRLLDYDFSIKKDIDNKELYKYYRLSFGYIFKVKEELTKSKWEISNTTKKISGFNCQKAVTNYKGRKWEAWFTSDIPLSKGPYIFDGLPGLIVLISDIKNNFIFELTSIKNQNSSLIFYEGNAILVNPKQLKKLYIDYYNDPFKELKISDTKVKIENSSGGDSDPNFNIITKKRRRELKQYNNPIDLSDIVDYPQ
ncbi:GLPGLI family protein [Chryseobacterium indoltheticum]|uniref:GLPGLI family protein n=1 Tax=Chryseobacterium indoltheticum TaxID=254 RepID=UPI00242FACBE|nr:GLPGLI family protein [Chryseobacterium indoltheticum]MDF2832310.1 hypothetical protein [Chryseobacterium indoltheticum]